MSGIALVACATDDRATSETAHMVRRLAAAQGVQFDETPVPETALIKFSFKKLDRAAADKLFATMPEEIIAKRAYCIGEASPLDLSGASKQFIRVGDTGSRTIFNFCPTCGATVYYVTAGREEHIDIPVGAFAEPTLPGATVSVYEERMHSLPEGRRWAWSPSGR